jgi:hypothetical protein
MSARRCNITVCTFLRQENAYADVEVSHESQRIFVLTTDLFVEVYDLAGRYLRVISDFADLFYTTDEFATTNEPPLLAIACNSILLGDPSTGMFAQYSLDAERIVFAKDIGLLPYSISGAEHSREVLISCARTGAVHRFDTETVRLHAVGSGNPRNPFLLASAKGRWVAVDSATATMVVHDDNLDKRTSVSFWPMAMRRDEKPPGNGRWVFGVDCSCDADMVVVLHGAGGGLVPSFWAMKFDSLTPQAFDLEEGFEPLRVCVFSGRILLLCVKDRTQYCLCVTDVLNL